MSPPSYRLVNFALRPAKYIERRMIVEGLKRLGKVAHLDLYRYVGFGSIYFSDFYLIHRELGVRAMVSIEHDAIEERVSFNVPFACIDLEFDEASAVLSDLAWDQKSIVWLDYDKRLRLAHLADIEAVVSQAPSGSVILVTVNAEPNATVEGRRAKLVDAMGKTVVPIDITDASLGGWGTARAFRRIINNRIAEVIRDRNGGLSPAQRWNYQQLFNFHYRDSQQMLTVGGVLFQQPDAAHVAASQFDELAFVSSGADAYEVVVPHLTGREIRYLDQRLPCDEPSALVTPGLQPEDVEEYAKIYRYVPGFVFVET